MAKLGTITLKGQSGADYEFDVYTWGADFNNVGAVYYISNRYVDSDSGWTHTDIYIGQTGDLSDRFDNHHKAQCFVDYDDIYLLALNVGERVNIIVLRSVQCMNVSGAVIKYHLWLERPLPSPEHPYKSGSTLCICLLLHVMVCLLKSYSVN